MKLEKGQKLIIDISPIIEREGMMDEYRFGHTREVTFIRDIQGKMLTDFEFFEGVKELIEYEQIIEIIHP